LAKLVRGSDKISEEAALHEGISHEMWQEWVSKSWIIPAGRIEE
jgi:hypothetical protein